MIRIHTIKGKSIREWAQQNLPYGAFQRMAREVDPGFGVYAPAGARRKKFTVSGSGGSCELEAFNEFHARAMAFDEHGWHPDDTRATLVAG